MEQFCYQIEHQWDNKYNAFTEQELNRFKNILENGENKNKWDIGAMKHIK